MKPASEQVGDAGLPFDLPGGPDAVLLLHGLTGSPFELGFVAERLHGAGMRCLGPVMAGHGGDPRDLARVRSADWVAGARAELMRLFGARRTFVVGSSMGALVACVLAHEHPERIDGLALLAPALRLRRAGRIVGALGKTSLARFLPLVPKLGGSDVRDPEMRRRNPAMAWVSLAAVVELQALGRAVDRMLPGIAAPTLVVAGGQDHTVALSGAKRIVKRVGGPGRLLVLPDSFHLVGIDVEREQAASAVLRFFEEIPVPGRGLGTATGG